VLHRDAAGFDPDVAAALQSSGLPVDVVGRT
jgi:hypothetical protein